jgi:acyl CoA:acetate/3-ketoacid CoA transferase
MRTVPVLTGAEGAQLIADSAVITVSSSSGLGCPDALLEAIGQRYEETGSPANLTTLHPIAAGDMASKALTTCVDPANCAGCWPAPTPPEALSWTRR